MKYKFLTEDMTWSYSRITCFDDCPYKWFLKYIYGAESKPLFFAQYGSFVHKILELYYKEFLPPEKAAAYFINNFDSAVSESAPARAIQLSYLNSGVRYFSSLPPVPGDVCCVEGKLNFKIDKFDFVGFTDLIRNGDTLSVTDHKSRALTPRSKKTKALKRDAELDRYLRQLYIYSKPIYEKLGKFPDILRFNCFRTGTIIEEPFLENQYKEALSWAENSVCKIINNDDWSPRPNMWYCKYLCDVGDSCEYKKMCGWG